MRSSITFSRDFFLSIFFYNGFTIYFSKSFTRLLEFGSPTTSFFFSLFAFLDFFYFFNFLTLLPFYYFFYFFNYFFSLYVPVDFTYFSISLINYSILAIGSSFFNFFINFFTFFFNVFFIFKGATISFSKFFNKSLKDISSLNYFLGDYIFLGVDFLFLIYFDFDLDSRFEFGLDIGLDFYFFFSPDFLTAVFNIVLDFFDFPDCLG
jgi:hypothetical protein